MYGNFRQELTVPQIGQLPEYYYFYVVVFPVHGLSATFQFFNLGSRGRRWSAPPYPAHWLRSSASKLQCPSLRYRIRPRRFQRTSVHEVHERCCMMNQSEEPHKTASDIAEGAFLTTSHVFFIAEGVSLTRAYVFQRIIQGASLTRAHIFQNIAESSIFYQFVFFFPELLL